MAKTVWTERDVEFDEFNEELSIWHTYLQKYDIRLMIVKARKGLTVSRDA